MYFQIRTTIQPNPNGVRHNSSKPKIVEATTQESEKHLHLKTKITATHSWFSDDKRSEIVWQLAVHVSLSSKILINLTRQLQYNYYRNSYTMHPQFNHFRQSIVALEYIQSFHKYSKVTYKIFKIKFLCSLKPNILFNKEWLRNGNSLF